MTPAEAAKQAQKPVIRFAGFTDAWEQRKLSNLAFISKGQQLGKSEMLADGAFYVLNGGQTPSGYTNRCNTDANTISISEGGNSCGFVIYNKQKFWSGAHNYTLTSLKSVDQVFLFEALKGLEKNLMALRVGTGLPNIQKPALQSFIIGFPSFEEQKAIGRLLVNVDYSVVLHQRKLDHLTSLKKALLQKMFPVEGEDRPLIRFSSFSDAWEQRELGNVSIRVSEKNLNNRYLEPFTNSAELGVVEQKDFFDHDVASKVNLANYYVVAKNDFVYNPRISTSAPVGPISRNKMDKYGLMSPLYTVFRPVSIVPLYLEQYFKSSHWYRFMKLNGNTGARSDRFAIKDTVFFEMPIPLPNTAEQLKIGRILELVDNILVLHQRKLEELQKLKKSLLQKMFI